jgi:hypothetical protein
MEGVPELRMSVLQPMPQSKPQLRTWLSPGLTAIEGVPEARASAWATVGLFPMLAGRATRAESPVPLPSCHVARSAQHLVLGARHGNGLSSSSPSDAQGSISLDGAASPSGAACTQSKHAPDGGKAWYDEHAGCTPAGHCNQAVMVDFGSTSDEADPQPGNSPNVQGSTSHHRSLTVDAAGQQDPTAGTLGLGGYDSGIDEVYGYGYC